MSDIKPKINIIALLVTGVISLVVGVLTVLATDYLGAKTLKLEYDVVTAENFSGSRNDLGIYVITLSNIGNVEIEKVNGVIKFDSGVIDEVKVSGIPSTQAIFTNDDTSININIDFLNSKERLNLQVLMSTINGSIEQPHIDIRAKGVNASEKQQQSELVDVFSTLSDITLPLLVAIMSFAFLSMARMRSVLSGGSKHTGEQKELFCYTLDAFELSNIALEIRSSSASPTYWALSDQLYSILTTINDKEAMIKGVNSQKYVIEYARMAESSINIIKLNMAKLLFKVGEIEEAKTVISDVIKTGDKIALLRNNTEVVLKEIAQN